MQGLKVHTTRRSFGWAVVHKVVQVRTAQGVKAFDTITDCQVVRVDTQQTDLVPVDSVVEVVSLVHNCPGGRCSIRDVATDVGGHVQVTPKYICNVATHPFYLVNRFYMHQKNKYNLR